VLIFTGIIAFLVAEQMLEEHQLSFYLNQQEHPGKKVFRLVLG